MATINWDTQLVFEVFDGLLERCDLLFVTVDLGDVSFDLLLVALEL
jgi:hypothetical protein